MKLPTRKAPPSADGFNPLESPKKKHKSSKQIILQAAQTQVKVASIEKISSWDIEQIKKYFSSWVEENAAENNVNQFPISTSQANHVLNFAQLAVKYNQVSVLKIIAKTDNHQLSQLLTSLDVSHYNLLQLAIKHGSLDCFKFLASINKHWLTEKLNNPQRHLDRASCISLTFYYGHQQLLEFLLNKLTINQPITESEKSKNSLQAIFHRQELKNLLNHKTANGNYVSHLAAMNSQLGMLAYLNKTKIYHDLFTQKNSTGKQPIHCAIDNNHVAAMMFILKIDRHKDIYLNKNNHLNNICFYATRHLTGEKFLVIKNLAENFTKIFTATDHHGMSPLKYLAQSLGYTSPTAENEKSILATIKKTGISFLEFKQKTQSSSRVVSKNPISSTLKQLST
jgi:hypothetical protein